MRELPLTKGYAAILDDRDFAVVSQYKWQAHVAPNTVYAYRSIYDAGKRKKMYLHRFLLGIEDPKVEVDHKDRNGLNCRRYNLRPSTKADNTHNTRAHKDSSSGFKGVSRNHGKWIVQIRGKCIGRFTNAYDAARAYDVAALKFFGEFAKTNVMLGLLEVQ